MKNHNNKACFVGPEGAEARANKTDINFMIFNLTFLKNFLYCDAIHDFFSVWMRTGSKTADINRF